MPVPLARDPTASQNVRVTHETWLSSASVPPAGSGILRTAHDRPFQTRDAARSGVELSGPVPPTAAQNRADGHDTLKSFGTADEVTPGRFGMACLAHAVPFHLSASVATRPEGLW